ncbi:ABC transporter ATP-binding protein [Alkalicoccobacillus murimartini]|uniref:Iron complex transport system ATP-binding protein n=1 Tax=Alkalicoccobacillus murimartini TaxID=171685 RepID=A0ABT9YIR2_9BACI|nr:ABC transporter ATP-binding protein [Alkalicoccobacillus murimartini]MDQ0207741.1 iron complex transport system ATP-binding protein [Alkalicoccobacillus murimartini]
MTAIQAESLHFRQGAFQLDDVSLHIPTGSMTAIIGPNGSGKSTLLRLVAQLLKLESGTIEVNQKDITTYKRKEFARTLAMMTQSHDAIPAITVAEFIAYGQYPYSDFGSNKHKQTDAIDWALQVTGLTKWRDRMVHTLSGGEKQRARIALALAQQTNIILLDEPTTFLDITHQFELMNLLEEINQTHNKTIVMVLHELQQAAAYCHQLIVMKQGRITAVGEPEQVLTEDLLSKVYQLEASVRFEQNYPIIIPRRNKT